VHDLSSADPRERGLSSVFAQLAHRALEGGEAGVRVAVVLQRLGGARLLACRACGALATCEPHGLALREGAAGLGCPAGCDAVPKVCRSCGSLRLVAVREGVSALAKRVAALLATEVTEVTATSGDIPADARVVVGTEAVLARVRSAEVVCFADLDDYLCAPRSHAALDALRAIGLAGRLVGARGAMAPGTVVVQTRLPTHPVVDAAVRGEPTAVLDAEVAAAASLGLPPHVATCAITGAGAADFAAAVSTNGVEVTRDGERFIAVAATHAVLCDALASAPRPDERVRVDVDPRDG
jgi:primosomal protein N' (replication factor Y)